MTWSMHTELPDAILDQAIGWLVQLQSGNVSAQTLAACALWRQANPLHEQAWQALHANEADFQTLASLPDGLALDTLKLAEHESHGRRQTLKLLGLGLLACGLGTWGLRQGPLASWRADYATATGERRTFTLDDGTRLQLNTASSVDVRFSQERRLIELKRGEIYIDTGADTQVIGGRRSFWVNSAHGRLQAIGTAFGVRDEGARLRLRVDQGVVAIHQPNQTVFVQAGQEYLINVDGAESVSQSSMNASAWTQGQLVAKGMRLRELTGELARYRHGWLSCDPAVADLTVSGVFQLADIDRALEALGDSLPVRIQRLTPFWTRVVAR